MSDIDPENYQDLVKWVTEVDVDGVNGNSTKKELQEAYQDYQSEGSETSETSENSTGNEQKQELDLTGKPSKDAPENETIFEQEEAELEADENQESKDSDSEEPESDGQTPTQGDDKQVETGTPEPVKSRSELSKQEIKEIHRDINQGMKFALGFLNIPVKQFSEERLDEIAATSKEAVNTLIPDRFKTKVGKGASFSSAVMPHVNALLEGQLERMEEPENNADSGDTEKEAETVEQESQEELPGEIQLAN